MKTQLALFHFKLPLGEKVRVMPENVEISARDIGVLRVSQENSVSFAEVSPLPGLSRETFSEVSSLENLELPCLRFALAAAKGLTKKTESFKVPISGLILEQDAPEKALEYEFAGYQAVKLKVGRNFKSDCDRLKAIANSTKAIKIRLDFNGQSTLRECQNLLQKIPFERIEYVEDPCAESFDYLTESGYSIAFDQNSAGAKVARRNSVKIIKPTRDGVIDVTGLKENSKFIVSSCFESNLGIYTLALAAKKWGLSSFAHGFDTAKYFRENLFDLKLTRGFLELPDSHSILERISSLVGGLKPIGEGEI